MRDIKFRAWDKINKLYFRECDFLYFCSGGIRFTWTDYGNDNAMMTELKDGDFELMQYTGLKDKKGKEIYEGDIVKFRNIDWANFMEDYCKKEFIKPIYWNNEDSCFDFDNRNIDFEGEVIDFENTKVIGNIYENPELLK